MALDPDDVTRKLGQIAKWQYARSERLEMVEEIKVSEAERRYGKAFGKTRWFTHDEVFVRWSDVKDAIEEIRQEEAKEAEAGTEPAVDTGATDQLTASRGECGPDSTPCGGVGARDSSGRDGVGGGDSERDRELDTTFYSGSNQLFEPKNPTLGFAYLSRMNKGRLEATFAQSIGVWKPWDWSNAMVGEVGEVCAEGLAILVALSAKAGGTSNLTKKMARVWPANQLIKNWNKPEDQRIDELKKRCAHELGDVVVYADLFAQGLGIPLEDCVIEAFNDKSAEIDSRYTLVKLCDDPARP